MYKCNNCGAVCTEPDTIYDSVPYGSTYVDYPSGDKCPSCGSDDIEEVEECKMCGEWAAVEYDLCQNCIDDIHQQVKRITDNLKGIGIDLAVLDDIIEREMNA